MGLENFIIYQKNLVANYRNTFIKGKIIKNYKKFNMRKYFIL